MVSTRHATFAERLQARLVSGFYAVSAALPLDLASLIGGTLARLIGPRLGITRRARRNIERALPELTPAARERVIRRMWENLGRVAAEYGHLTRLKCFGPETRVEVLGSDHLDRALASGKPVIFFTGHFGNWEVAGVAAVQYGLDFAQVYRAANNPAVEAVMLAFRRSLGGDPISKGAAGARRIIAALRSGKTLAMLVDQKMNDGIAVPFFGRDAMTAPALAELGLRYDCALLPVRVDRTGGAHFRLTVFPPLELKRSGDRQADIRAVMVDVNTMLEAWIREQPEQWFWLHNRWPD
jgi:KDO2-lipid IV(A) lauroyltransferase